MEIKFAPGFKKSWDKLFSPWWAPYRAFKWVLRIPREIKWFIQRGRRGYADCDVWSLDSYILEWLPEAIKKVPCNGHPIDVKNLTEWKKIVNKISKKLEYGRKLEDCYDKPYNKKVYKKHRDKCTKEFEEGMDLLKKYFFNLWD